MAALFGAQFSGMGATGQAPLSGAAAKCKGDPPLRPRAEREEMKKPKQGTLDRRLSNRSYRALYEKEKFILEASELICKAMEAKRISRAELARRLGTTRGFVTQILSGSRNLTLSTLARVMWTLGFIVTLDSIVVPKGGRRS